MPVPESRLLLASTSIYRAQLLRQLKLRFQCEAPHVDEYEIDGEAPPDRALRLAQAKAAAVAADTPRATVIGSDQVATCAEKLLHKPGSSERQIAQLRQTSGQAVSFYTGLCVIDAAGTVHRHLDHTVCRLRQLGDAEIDRYVAAERAVDCAGGFRVEALGITLFEHVRSDDPSALVGLPLIGLSRILRDCGWHLP